MPAPIVPVPVLPATLAPATILVVDDEVAIRRLLRNTLERAGHHVVEAGNGRDALARAAADLGLITSGVEPSPLPGPSGNVEYFLWLTVPGPDDDPSTARSTSLEQLVSDAVEKGPQ